MKLYTFYTDSHRKMFELFESNFPYKTDLQLNIKRIPQECQTGSYMSDGWMATMKRKVEYILESIEETKEGSWFVHSDCDVLLFNNWTDILKNQKTNNLDMLIQNDYVELCAGFFFCKSNEKTKKLWTDVLDNLSNFPNDQSAMNHFIKNSSNLKIGILPDSYFTYGLLNRGTWNGEEFVVPKDIKMFHANWTEGISNKLKLINYVKENLRRF